MPIRISGVLKNGLGKPIPNCTIELKSKKTTLSVIATTEADQLVDVIGSYTMDVEPGEYSVSLCITGFPRKPVGDIQVYSDSRPGTLNDFLMMPDESDLTPELVLIFQQLRDEAKQVRDEAKQAAKIAEQAQLASTVVQERVEELHSDVADKKSQIDAAAEAVEQLKSDAEAFSQTALENAEKTAQDLLAVSDFKDTAENAANNAQVSSSASDKSASRAEAAANLVKKLSTDATTLPASTEATAFWDADTNTLNLGVPQGVKGDTGPEGIQGVPGIQGVQGVKGDKGDKGDIGPEAQLSPLLTAISALDTAAEQIICLTGKDNAATTALTELGRKLIAATTAETARQEIGAAAEGDVLKIGNNLSEISTTAAKTTARGNLGLGSAAILNSGTETGNVITVGVSQPKYLAQSIGINGWRDNSMLGYTSDVNVWRDSYVSLLKQKCNLSGQWSLFSSLGFYTDPGASPNLSGIAMACTDGNIYTRTWVFRNDGNIINSNGGFFWNQANTAVDANGFIKRASPVVKLFSDGSCELNNESKGVTAERLSEGVYRLSGSLMGFNSDGLWDIEVPSDDNKQPLIWVKSTVEANGDIIVKTYHRTHPNAPKFAQNNISGYVDGDPIDIPAGRWLDLRVQVYNDEQSYDISEK